MKIEVVGNTSLVTSVTVELDEETKELHILINTRDRWVPHQLSGGWGLFTAQCPRDEPIPDYRLIAVGFDEHGELPGAEVVFLPEGMEERFTLLSGVAHHATEKDQISYLLTPRRLPQSTKLQHLANWPAR